MAEDREIIRQGYVDFQEKTLGIKSWKRRYFSIHRNGICYIYEDETKSSVKFTFHLEGGERLETGEVVKNKKNPFSFTVMDDKQDWCFSCASRPERQKWLDAVESVLKQLHAIVNLDTVMRGADSLDTMEGQLKFAETMASCGQVAKARRVYSKLIVDYGDHDAVHRAYEIFLVKYTDNIYQAESNFVRRLRFLCVPREFLQTSEGKELQKISQRIAFLSSNESDNDQSSDVNGMKINQYRARTIYNTKDSTLENDWPFWLFKVNAGKLQEARTLVQKWVKLTDPKIKKIEYSYQEIEERCWKIIRNCVKDTTGNQKLMVRLEELEKSIQAKVERADHEANKKKKGNESDEDAITETKSNDQEDSTQKGHKKKGSSEDFLGDVFAAMDDILDRDDDSPPEFEESLTPKDRTGDHNTILDDLDDILGATTSPIAEPPPVTFATKSLFGGATKFVITEEDFVDDMELDFFHRVEGLLTNSEHHFFPWTAFILIWIVRRDNMEHIGGPVEQQSPINAVLEFIYLFAKGCFQHLNNNTRYRPLMAALYHISDIGPRSKICLSACRVLADARIAHLDKISVSEFLESQTWLTHLPLTSRETASNFLRKGLQVEIRKNFSALDDIYEKCVLLNKFYDKLGTISEEKYVQDPIKRQDADVVQGRCTWGPRKDNTFDRNAFDLVCKHRQIRPLNETTAAMLGNDFDAVYLMFCQSLAEKLRNPLVDQLSRILSEQDPTVQILPAKNFEKFSKRIKTELSQYASPKAARILDFLSVEVAFDNIKDIIVGFVKIGKGFKICRIANQLSDKIFVKNNVRFLYVYVVAEHPDNNFIKLICELRVTLKSVYQLNNEHRQLFQHFETFLGVKEATEIQKEVLKKLGDAKQKVLKQKSRQSDLDDDI